MTVLPSNTESVSRMRGQECVSQVELPSAEHVLELAQRFKDMSSILGKQRIIQQEFTAYPQLETVFYFALSEDFATHVGDTLYYRLRNSVEHTHVVNGEGTFTLAQAWTTFTRLHNELVIGQLSGNAKETALYAFLGSCTRAAAEVFLKLFARNLFTNLTATTVNNALGYEAIPVWGVQLCNTYVPTKKYADVSFWWATPKINGFRATYKNGRLYSRTGKAWHGPGFDEICHECMQLGEKGGFNTIDGELTVATEGTAPLSFQELSSILRNSVRRTVEPALVCFNVFAAVNTSHKTLRYGVENTADMYSKLHRVLPTDAARHSYVYLRAVPSTCVQNNATAITAQCRTYVCSGYEGIVLRHPVEAYNLRRSNKLLKYKFFHECDLVITDVLQGTGKYQNVMGALLLAGTVGDRRISVACGTGFDEQQRRIFWEMRKQLVGQVATLKYQDFTDRNFMGQCSLAFPVFMHLKES